MREHSKANLYYQLSLLDPLILKAYPKISLFYNPKDPQLLFKLSDKLINYAQLVDTHSYCVDQGWLRIKSYHGLISSSPVYLDIYAPAKNICSILPKLRLRSLQAYAGFTIDLQEREDKQVLYFKSQGLTLSELFTAVFGNYVSVPDQGSALDILIRGFTLERLSLQIEQEYKELVAILGADLNTLELIAQAKQNQQHD
jgi:hypothetical protein